MSIAFCEAKSRAIRERSNSRREARQEPAQAHPALRDCHRRETTLDAHVRRERVYLASEPRKRVGLGQQSAYAPQPDLSVAPEQLGRLPRRSPPVDQSNAPIELLQLVDADASTVVVNFHGHDEQHPGNALQRRAGIPSCTSLTQEALANLDIRPNPIAGDGGGSIMHDELFEKSDILGAPYRNRGERE
jgi:hypothetical protein